jgi:hypothetical protein
MPDPHLGAIRKVNPSAEGCEDCLRSGGQWLHLRICLTCGYVNQALFETIEIEGFGPAEAPASSDR